MPNLYVALTHYPVVNKKGNVIASALTNLDLHDISRAAKTYGLKSFFVVTPLEDQKELAPNSARDPKTATLATAFCDAVPLF